MTEIDTLFDETETEQQQQGPGIQHERATLDSCSVRVPDGFLLAHDPSSTNVVKGLLLGSSAKSNPDGPTSVKASIRVLAVSGAGADFIRHNDLNLILMTKMERVETDSGVRVYAKLIDTTVSPVIYKGVILHVTLVLGRLSHKGMREAAVRDLSPGAEVELRDLVFAKRGVEVPWLSSSEFKVTKRASLEAPRLGITMVIDSMRSFTSALLLSTTLNSTGARSQSAPSAQMEPAFQTTKSLLATTKKGTEAKITELFPNFSTPAEPLKIEESDQQIPPVFYFHKTKTQDPRNPSKGVLFTDPKLAWFLHKTQPDNLAETFPSGGCVGVEFTARSMGESKFLGLLYVVQTKLQLVPNASCLEAGPGSFLTLVGPTVKVPPSLVAAPFGVNDRSTAELLMEHVLPHANMLLAPGKSKIFARTYDKTTYNQDVIIDTQSQLTIDVPTTLRNVGVRISQSTVAALYDGAEYSTPEPVSGESLVDMLGTEHKPAVSTLSNGGVVSLRETSTYLADDTLEFYAVFSGALKIAQADGNFACGTNDIVGDAAFRAASGESAKNMLKTGEMGLFAVRVRAKQHDAALAAHRGEEDEEQEEEDGDDLDGGEIVDKVDGSEGTGKKRKKKRGDKHAKEQKQ